jgi:hypothetical protein
VEVSFEEASQLAERFLLFRVSDNTVRKQTEGYGNAQAQAEKEWIENAEDEKAWQVRERNLKPQPGRIYASLDGAHVPLQHEWRELKTLCWYKVEKIRPGPSQNQFSPPMGEQRDLQAKEMKYHCDVTEAEQCGRLLWATGLQNQVVTNLDFIQKIHAGKCEWNEKSGNSSEGAILFGFQCKTAMFGNDAERIRFFSQCSGHPKRLAAS